MLGGNPRSAAAATMLATDVQHDGVQHATTGSGATLRLYSQRAREAVAQALPGQDYALLIEDSITGVLAFCVCDGVGSSYAGDFAARYLAERLTHLLAHLPTIPPDLAALEAEIIAHLSRWADEGQQELLRSPVRGGGDLALVREVLEELRADYGSETVFLAGRIEREPRTDGDVSKHMLLCWMGNVRARLSTTSAPPVEIHTDGDSARWSTARRLRGRLTLRAFSALGLRRLIVYTDGIQSLQDSLTSLTDGELAAQVARLQHEPASDDITVLDVSFPEHSHVEPV